MTELKHKTPHRNILSDAAGKRPRESINDYTKGVRRKLYMLFGLLALVIIMMSEARKPENWMWMGFKSGPGNGDALLLEPVQMA